MAPPSKQEQKEASARALKELGADHSKLEKATFLLLASARESSFDFSNDGNSLHFKNVSPGMIACQATAISKDGYFLTAAHATAEHCYLAGWMDGKPTVSPARVVYRKSGTAFGDDFAILHAEHQPDCPIQLGTLGPAESDIYGFACQRWPSVKFTPVAGKVLHRPDLKSGEGATLIAADLPLWRGDSGAAVLSKRGNLVGVFVGVTGSWTSFRGFRVACAPAPDFVQSIIDADRCRYTSR